jgi:hypothetical protein
MELKTFYAQDVNGNVIPSPTVYIYTKGTTTPIAGLEDENGDALANPFTGTADGLISVAAPDGEYDMRVTGSGRDTTLAVQFIDVTALAAAADASATAAAASASTAASISASGLISAVSSSVVYVNASGNLTSGSGAAFNGTVGATTPNTGAFTTISASGEITANGGIDVTGTATMDGLTVDASSAELQKSTGSTFIIGTKDTAGSIASPIYTDIKFEGYLNGTNALIRSWDESGSTGFGRLEIKTNDASSLKRRALFDYNGDISFYEDTGTTALFFWDASAESLGIGTSSPNAAAILDVQSTTKGIRFPNMTTTQKNAMANVAGMQVFDTTLSKMCFNTGSAWETITSA